MLGTTKEGKIIDGYESTRLGSDVATEGDTCTGPEDYPWIKIGSIYATPTFTNDTAWVCLVKRLKADSNSRKIVVFTGRHGDAVNWELSDGTPILTYDANHTVEDNQKNTKYKNEMSPAQVTIQCVIGLGDPHREQVWAKTKEWLNKGYTVIYAWCFSFYTWNSKVGGQHFADFVTARAKYTRKAKELKVLKNNTQLAFKERRALQQPLEKEVKALETQVNNLGTQVQTDQDRERTAKLGHAIIDTAKEKGGWTTLVLYHATKDRPTMTAKRRPPTRNSLL